MSHSPTVEQQSRRESYELGWVAIHRMLREGHSWSGREQHCVYLNTRDGRFANVSGVSGLDLPDDGRAAALVDWDLDGRQDLWISGRNSPRVRLLLNRAPDAGQSLDLRLEGTRGARDAIGARVEVHVDGEAPRVASVRAGEGYLAQSSRWLHFGLGPEPKLERVVVRWPRLAGESGPTLEEFEGLAPGGRYVLRQGSGRAEPFAVKALVLPSAKFEPVALSEKARIVLTARPPLPPAPLLVPGVDEPSDLRANTPRPLLVTVWASWCAPCIGELREFVAREREIADSGLQVLALSADEAAARPAAIEMLQRLQWEQLAAFATSETLDTLDALQRMTLDRRRRMPLPTSFLVDESGAVAVIYKGPVSVDVLLADVARLRASPSEVRAAAVPFPGRWISTPRTRAPLEALQEAYAERGLRLAVDDVAQRRMELRKTSPDIVFNEMGLALARQGRVEEAAARFREAVSAAPDNLDAQLNLAIALHELLRVPEAIEGYKRVLRLDPRNAAALYNLGLARCTLGDLEAARTELAALELVDPQAAARLRQQMDTIFKR